MMRLSPALTELRDRLDQRLDVSPAGCQAVRLDIS